jgi:signal recognition particle GTPase
MADNASLQRQVYEMNKESPSIESLHSLEILVKELQQQIEDKERELEDVRQRLTQLAELFERKPIKQHYSFDVLLDFVADKAQRLFHKYEAAVRERRGHKEEHRGQQHQRIAELEEELRQAQVASQFTEQVCEHLVPRFEEAIDIQISHQGLDPLSVAFEVLQ